MKLTATKVVTACAVAIVIAFSMLIYRSLSLAERQTINEVNRRAAATRRIDLLSQRIDTLNGEIQTLLAAPTPQARADAVDAAKKTIAAQNKKSSTTTTTTHPTTTTSTTTSTTRPQSTTQPSPQTTTSTTARPTTTTTTVCLVRPVCV